MMNWQRLQISLLGLVLFVAPATAKDEPVSLPDTVVGRQAGRLFEVLATGNREKIKEFIQDNFATSFLGAIPLEHHVNANLRFGEKAGNLMPTAITSSSDHSLRL